MIFIKIILHNISNLFVDRNGFVFDIFDNEDEVFESKTWRNINFLYNRAAKGYDYHCRGQSKGE